jgi:hypothetical protein
MRRSLHTEILYPSIVPTPFLFSQKIASWGGRVPKKLCPIFEIRIATYVKPYNINKLYLTDEYHLVIMIAFNGGHCLLNTLRRYLMSLFQVGDRVRVISELVFGPEVGYVGTVQKVKQGKEDEYYEVYEIDDLGGIDVSDLELVPEAEYREYQLSKLQAANWLE